MISNDAPNPLDHVARNGLLDRRLFLSKTFLSATSLAFLGSGANARAARPTEPWMTKPGAPFTNYGVPSPHAAGIVRWVSANPDLPGNGVAWTPLQDLDGIITPSGLHFERHHNGVPQIDPARHELLLDGLVDRPLKFTLDALLRYPRESRILAIECGGNSNAGWNIRPAESPVGTFHGLVSCSEWTGVPLRVLLDEASVKWSARWAIAEGADAFGMTISLPLSKLRDDCLLAVMQNGEPLRPEQGYPLRLIVPGWEGVTHVKWLRTLQLTDRPVMARNETAEYTELQPDGKARMFTFVMEAKSLITNPSAGMHLATPGYYQISGIAWSGRGKISRVEISADGGKTWADAELNEPVLPRAFTRFRVPWQWQGQSAILQSRATDESGYRQPTRAALIAERGRHGYFHYNAIVSWEVTTAGIVRHVYVDAAPEAGAGSSDPFDHAWD